MFLCIYWFWHNMKIKNNPKKGSNCSFDSHEMYKDQFLLLCIDSCK